MHPLPNGRGSGKAVVTVVEVRHLRDDLVDEVCVTTGVNGQEGSTEMLDGIDSYWGSQFSFMWDEQTSVGRMLELSLTREDGTIEGECRTDLRKPWTDYKWLDFTSQEGTIIGSVCLEVELHDAPSEEAKQPPRHLASSSVPLSHASLASRALKFDHQPVELDSRKRSDQKPADTAVPSLPLPTSQHLSLTPRSDDDLCSPVYTARTSDEPPLQQLHNRLRQDSPRSLSTVTSSSAEQTKPSSSSSSARDQLNDVVAGLRHVYSTLPPGDSVLRKQIEMLMAKAGSPVPPPSSSSAEPKKQMSSSTAANSSSTVSSHASRHFAQQTQSSSNNVAAAVASHSTQSGVTASSRSGQVRGHVPRAIPTSVPSRHRSATSSATAAHSAPSTTTTTPAKRRGRGLSPGGYLSKAEAQMVQNVRRNFAQSQSDRRSNTPSRRGLSQKRPGHSHSCRVSPQRVSRPLIPLREIPISRGRSNNTQQQRRPSGGASSSMRKPVLLRHVDPYADPSCSLSSVQTAPGRMVGSSSTFHGSHGTKRMPTLARRYEGANPGDSLSSVRSAPTIRRVLVNQTSPRMESLSPVREVTELKIPEQDIPTVADPVPPVNINQERERLLSALMTNETTGLRGFSCNDSDLSFEDLEELVAAQL
eukprot:TRINITY_DN1380_c1_g1_i1.p1 TRINITY_DN1380_c1_g1~~TRINITY_DN1380_c1_g1_i1.p1  ORF type:complete len:645 (+),score=135.51 TRINITY_DN1380_c1_g1_i1:157-2091(+)